MHEHVQMAHTKAARIGIYEIRKCQKCTYECSTYQDLIEHREDNHSESSTNENLIHDEKLHLKEDTLNNFTKPEKEEQDSKEKFKAETAEEEKKYECKGSPQSEQIHEGEANGKFKRFERILEEKRALI